MHSPRASYKIRQVSDLTGANEFLLRAWENRYSAFTPARTKTGRRLYSETDVLKAQALVTLTKQGVRIGEIAQLDLGNLNKLIKKSSALNVALDSNILVKHIITSANQFNWPEVHHLILREKQKATPLHWIHGLITPLLAEIGRQVNAGLISITQEHILSAIIKEHVVSQSGERRTKKNGPRIILAAPEGDFHELGILIAKRIANELGANTLFLGPHMPMSELAAICVRYKATHLLMTSNFQTPNGAKAGYLKFLNFLDRTLDSKVTLWLAGANALKYPLSLKRPFKTFNSFNVYEEEVRKCLE